MDKNNPKDRPSFVGSKPPMGSKKTTASPTSLEGRIEVNQRIKDLNEEEERLGGLEKKISEDLEDGVEKAFEEDPEPPLHVDEELRLGGFTTISQNGNGTGDSMLSIVGAMEIGGVGCLIKSLTVFEGCTSEALEFLPNVKIADDGKLVQMHKVR